MPITYDTGSANTLGANSTTVTTTSITTAENNELLILFAFGAADTYFESFRATTDPSIGSVSYSITLYHPIPGTWTKVADSFELTGADTTNAFGHTVKNTSGTTGTLEATAGSGISSRHGLIIASFKMPSHPTLSAPALIENSAISGFPKVAYTFS